MTTMHPITKLFIALLAMAMLASCSKDEVMAPNGQPAYILKGGGNGQVDGDGPDGNDGTSDGTDLTGKGTPSGVNGLTRDFEGEGGPDGGGISDDGDDEGDKEKSNKKPRVN